MKRCPSTRSGLKAPLLLCLSLLSCVMPLLLAQAPSWWEQRGLLSTAGGVRAAPADYAALNQGQLKNFARAAMEEMDARLASVGGAGSAIHDQINMWMAAESASSANNYAAVNLGQLKAVAQLFYGRLNQLNPSMTYPWGCIEC